MHEWLPHEEDVDFFQTYGYWIAPKLISDESLMRLKEHMDRVYSGQFQTSVAPWRGYWTPDENPPALRKTDNSHWADYVLRELATNYKIGSIAAKLMTSRCIRLWHDQLLYKPGNTASTSLGGNVGWHQDYAYWQCAASPTLLTAWVAFDDVDLSNGCMQVVPRSNQWGLMDVSDFFEQDMTAQQEAMSVPNGEAFAPVPLVLRAGQVSFHHCLTIHGSGANTTSRPRRSLAIHLMTGDTRYRAGSPSNGHMNVELLGGHNGDLFTGERFPVLYCE